MLCFPNCKINLGLYVTNRRDDGYHDIETVFFPVALRDTLEIVPAKGESLLNVSGNVIAGNASDNLVWKAYLMMKSRYKELVPELDIYLHKVIPMGAGLGGGSADGAFMLRLINDYFGLGLSDEELMGMALDLGSDCPFFILNTPQFASGRGEVLTPVAIDLSPYHVVLVCPEIHVHTGKAFQMITPKAASFDLKQLAEIAVEDWRDKVGNDFEEPVFAQHPELKKIKEQLYEQGAIYAAMSGSGSCVFGIFSGEIKMELEIPYPHKVSNF